MQRAERERGRVGTQGREKEKRNEREGEKEMQRLPYNGAPRAHKLRHNVISSSLFNERWQRAAHTFYPAVSVVRAPLSFSMLSSCPTVQPHRPPRKLVASRALRCQVGLKRNPPTYRAARRAFLSPFPGSRYHFRQRENALPPLPIIIPLLRARYTSSVTAVFAFAITRQSFAAQCIHGPFREYIGFLGLSCRRDLMRSILT